MNEKKPFWTSLPGILTGLAALIVAIGGLIGTLIATGVILGPTPMPTPVINYFIADPSSISAGESSTLSWSVSDATDVTIDPEIGSVKDLVAGTRTVSPSKTTTYTLTAENEAGSVDATIQVIVEVGKPVPVINLPVINSFTASPSSISAGEISTLSWSVSGATRVTIDYGIGSVALTGTRVVSPAETTTYTLTAENEAGSVDTKTTQVIVAVSKPVISYFRASPDSIGAGASSTLSWSVSGATRVTIDYGIGSVASTGTRVVSPAGTTTYTLTAENEAGSVYATARVIVAVSKPVISYFRASPDSIGAGASSTLSWSVSGATRVTISQGIGSVASTGTRVVSPAGTTTYTLTAENEAGSVYATTTVSVTTEQVVRLTNIAAEDGHVRSDGTVNPYPNVGDTGTNLGVQAFLSFDISGIPTGSTILDVVVDFSKYDTLGDPFGSLGCLRAYLQNYGTLDAGDYFTDYPLGAILRFCSSYEMATPQSDSNVASALQSRLGSSRFQLRLQFKDKESDGDGTADMVRFGTIRLTVTYSTP